MIQVALPGQMFSMDLGDLPIERKALTQPVETKQLPINDKSKQALIDLRMDMFNDEVTQLANDVFAGRMTIGQWEESMKALIRGLHTSVTTIQKGGWDVMTQADWGKMGNPLKEQYKYLHNFAKYIEEHKDTISLKYIESRSKLYADASQATGNKVVLPDDIVKQLPYIPKDGSSDCMTHCKCHWELKVVDKDKQSQTVTATWTLSAAEHCDTCIERDGKEVTFLLKPDIIVPATIGYVA